MWFLRRWSLALLFLATHSLAQNVQQQRNSYLDLWKNVFDVLDTDKIDAEVGKLETQVLRGGDEAGADAGAETSADTTTKHRLMDVLESRRKEKRLTSFGKGIASQYGRVFGSGAGPGQRPPPKFRQIGIPVENASFESKLCFKMQNLGNADKYHGVAVGSPGCGDETASSMMTWRTESAFTIDCSLSSVMHNVTEGSFITSPIRAALGGHGDGLLEPPMSSQASCTFSVVSDNISTHAHKPGAAMLKLVGVPLPNNHTIDVAPLNAVRIKLCNLPSAWSVDAAPSQDSDIHIEAATPDLTLETIRLNGKRLVTQALSGEVGPSCATHTYRVPSVGLSSDGFVLSGSMIVNEAFKFGAGRASSVEVSIGSTSLLESAEE
jgi:hypothetical protein